MSDDKIYSIEETLSRLSGESPSKLDWEMADDPNGKLSCIFLRGRNSDPNGKSRVCVFCKKPMVPPDWNSLEVETTDRGKVYIFFCGPNCFGPGSPKIAVI